MYPEYYKSVHGYECLMIDAVRKKEVKRTGLNRKGRRKRSPHYLTNRMGVMNLFFAFSRFLRTPESLFKLLSKDFMVFRLISSALFVRISKGFFFTK
jgi:hypothetical protein